VYIILKVIRNSVWRWLHAVSVYVAVGCPSVRLSRRSTAAPGLLLSGYRLIYYAGARARAAASVNAVIRGGSTQTCAAVCTWKIPLSYRIVAYCRVKRVYDVIKICARRSMTSRVRSAILLLNSPNTTTALVPFFYNVTAQLTIVILQTDAYTWLRRHAHLSRWLDIPVSRDNPLTDTIVHLLSCCYRFARCQATINNFGFSGWSLVRTQDCCY